MTILSSQYHAAIGRGAKMPIKRNHNKWSILVNSSLLFISLFILQIQP